MTDLQTVFVGESFFVRFLPGQIERFARFDDPVLITGETGTGKSILAWLLHNARFTSNPLIRFMCTAIPETLFESILMGSEKGAFTGSDAKSLGLVSHAAGGTLWLDEIGDLPLPCQAKLLGVFDGHYRTLGGKKDERVEARLVAATNHDLASMVSKGDFREDLFHRLNVLEMHIPPLRERPEDIVPLLQHFARQKSMKLGSDVNLQLDEQSLRVLCQYRWPGNVRELRSSFTRVLVNSLTNRVSTHAMAQLLGLDLSLQVPVALPVVALELPTLVVSRPVATELAFASSLGRPQAEPPQPIDTSRPVVRAVLAAAVPVTTPKPPDASAEYEELETIHGLNAWARAQEKDVILRALVSTKFNRKQAAHMIKLDYKGFLYLMKTSHGIRDFATETLEPGVARFATLEALGREKARLEKALIARTLVLTFWNRRRAAHLLGLDYKALLYRMKKLGLNDSDFLPVLQAPFTP
ncbi:MAG: sigma 54-interacting transcriptional regulator [Candidatus Doudnabacteria bacterium]|nr:sigma 54-interacting transcriptional regulator [Candidatus Doudnabacteria bacterium]